MPKTLALNTLNHTPPEKDVHTSQKTTPNGKNKRLEMLCGQRWLAGSTPAVRLGLRRQDTKEKANLFSAEDNRRLPGELDWMRWLSLLSHVFGIASPSWVRVEALGG